MRTRKPAVEVTFVSLRMAVQFLDFDCSNTDPDSLYQKLHHKAVVVHRVKNRESRLFSLCVETGIACSTATKQM